MSLSELKPCPFCGGEAEINQIGNEATHKRGYEVKCLTWGCSTVKRAMVIREPLSQARQFAVERWNSRAEGAQTRTDVEPVAWLLVDALGTPLGSSLKPIELIVGETLQPLYTTPAALAVVRPENEGCDVCGYDCSAANPPVSGCPRLNPPPTDAPGMSREAVEKVLADYFGLRPYAEMAAGRADLRGKIRDGYDVNEPTKSDLADAADAILALASLGGRVEEYMASGGRVQAGPDGPTDEPLSDGGPGYDAGSVVWHSSDGESGPDVGIQLGLGRGFSLYAGELPTSTLEDHEIPKEYPDGWWIVLYGPSDQWIIGAVPDRYVAQEAVERMAGLACPAKTDASSPSEASAGNFPPDEPLPSPSPVRGAGEEESLFPLLASAWFYGGWEAETHNERKMQAIMEAAGWWPIADENDLLARLETPAHD